jgi:hypothetical protein
MAERPGGFEKREITEGFRTLTRAHSLSEFKAMIESMPVLRSPIFHAQLRQYRLSNVAEFEKQPGDS